MDFYEVLAGVIEVLQREGRTSYRALKRQFGIDDAYLEDLKVELIDVKQLAVDHDGTMLVWTGAAPPSQAGVPPPAPPASQRAIPDASRTPAATLPAASPGPDAERRQLTVLFCDLVDSTALARHLDPEDYREVVRAYQATGADVMQRFNGYIAQYLGDGLLVYFGYPQAHEDNAQRAVGAGLALLDALAPLQARLATGQQLRLAVRLGIHTGLVVVGAMGTGGRQETLALGDTPNVAARLQGLARPDTVVVSDTTWRLVQGYVIGQPLGPQALKGIETPVLAYQVLGMSGAQSRLDVVSPRGLTPLVGREAELALLRARWGQAWDGFGQVVLLSGEAGIGKSRLVQVVTEWVGKEGATCLALRCSPYHTHSALYPVIAHVQHVLGFDRDDTAEGKLVKLERVLAASRLPLQEAVPLFAALLTLPPPTRYPPVQYSPQQQRRKTHDALVTWLLEETERQPVLAVWEDLHWADPSTLELLGLVIAQCPTAHMLTVLTARPEFHPPWPPRSHLTHLTLNRFTRPQVEEMAQHVAGGKRLPAAVLPQIVAKTDGVPLYVEEMTKAVLESGGLQDVNGHYEVTGTLAALAIPATLQDSLMARLDRLVTAKAVAQYAAVIGRHFSYALLHAVTRLDEATLQRELARLVEAELVYQRGVLPQATYVFKHALVTDIAYQSLLRSTRQQVHQRTAQVLAEHFPEIAETQPELVAHHYTEAGLSELAVHYWQQAGQRATQRSAHQEAVQHLTTALALLATLPETPGRAQQELDLQMALGPAMVATRGPAAPEVEQTYARARVLCQQVGETPQLFEMLRGLCWYYRTRGALHTARELGEQLYRLAQRAADPTHLLEAHDALGSTLLFLGEFAAARTHLEQGIALADPAEQQAQALRYGVAPGVWCRGLAASALWCLGYPTQAVQCNQEALALAQGLDHPLSLAFAQLFTLAVHHYRREVPTVQAQAKALLTLATAHGFPQHIGFGTFFRGWVPAVQGQSAVGLAQMHQGLAAVVATGLMLMQPQFLVLLAEAMGRAGQVAEGLRLLVEALTACEASGRGDLLAEAYRLQGELLLHQAIPDAPRAEACFQQALAIAHRQQAKSWELRAAMSLSRLWQQQGKRAEAHALLAPIYGWFTEGFDTADLQEAKALLAELG